MSSQQPDVATSVQGDAEESNERCGTHEKYLSDGFPIRLTDYILCVKCKLNANKFSIIWSANR
jgi:hypothetical protein